MAKIPIVQRSVGMTREITAPLISGQPLTGGALEGIAELGETVSDVSGAIGNQLIRIKRQDAINETAKKVTSFQRALQTEFINYTQTSGEDAYGGQDRLLKFAESSAKEILKDVKDPELQSQIRIEIDNIITNRLDDYARHEASQRRVVSQRTRDDLFDTLSTNSFHGIGTVDENLDKFSRLITSQIDSGQISESDGEGLLLTAKRGFSERQLAGIIYRNPESAVELIQTGLYDDYLDTKTLEHYKQVADREKQNRVKLEEARQKEITRINIESANKELTDSMLAGDVEKFKENLGKHRETLSDSDYTRWTKEYQNMIDNSAKPVANTINNQVLTDFQVQALTGEGLKSAEEMQTFRLKVSRAVADRQISVENARKILSDAENITQDVSRQAQLRESVQTIEALHKAGLFGKGVNGELTRESVIRDLYNFTSQNPDKPTSEFTQKVFEPKIVERFWGLFGKKKVVPSTEEIAQRAEEMSRKPLDLADEYLKSYGVE